MWKKYKFTHSEESKFFLTADTHFRHEIVRRQRGYRSVAEHDDDLIKNWNDVVRPQDYTAHLGDFVLGAGQDSEKVCRELIFQLNGHIYMLWGNHLAGLKQIYKQCIKEQYGLDGNELEIYPITWQNKITFVGYYMLAQVKTPNVEK